MAHKKKGRSRGPVPAGNRTHFGPGAEAGPPTEERHACDAPADEQQDPKRRLGNFEGKGEHAFVQPGGKNDAQRNNKRK
jgi:hypothetical protein